MRRGSLAFVAILVLGSITKLLMPQGQTGTTGSESRSGTIPSKVTPPPQESDLAKARKSADWYPTELREKIRDFFGEQGTGLDLLEDKAGEKNGGKSKNEDGIQYACESTEIKNWCVPPGSRNKIHFVIATIPDPVHTHLGLFFDRSIDAIQLGATSQNYLFDRAIMPWPYFDEPVGQKTDEDKLLSRVRESYPGLMILRSEAATEPIFVFVVGETPTAGINKQQFFKAVEIIHEIREGKDDVDPRRSLDFGVLGPSFSGSLYSLQQILWHYLDVYPNAPANHAGVLPVYSVLMATHAIKEFGMNAPSQVRIAIFMEDGQAALDELTTYTVGLGYRPSDIAVLNEDDTAYGVSGFSHFERTDPQAHFADALILSFPRGISQFRSAYSKDLQIQGQAADPNQPQRRNLRLDLEVTGSDEDNVAPYATTQTALSQEAVMLALVSELRRRRSKFLLIRATDPLDELFLASYLGSKYPDARLVVPTPDLLFARDESGALDGALGLNTYPLSPAYMNPYCSPTDGPSHNYPAATSVGLYNATAALIGGLFRSGEPPPDEHLPVSAVVEPLSARMNPCRLSPSQWLTIVSRNAVYPIKVLPHLEGSLLFPKSSPAMAESAERNDRTPTLWVMLCVLCLVLLFNHVRCSLKSDPLGYWQTAKQLKDPAQSTMGKTWILWSGAVALVGMLVVFISSVTPFSIGVRGSSTMFVAILIWVSLLLFVSFVIYDFWTRRKEPVLAVSFLVASVCLVWVGIAYAHASSREMVLWQQRTLSLSSHVSPATPLLLLLSAFYAWFYFSLKSESLTDWRTPRLPNRQDLPPSYAVLSESLATQIREIIHTFGSPSWVFKRTGIVVGLLVVEGVLVGPNHVPIRSLEGVCFDIAYSILFGLALVLLVTTLLRTVALWWNLQPLLFYLDFPGMKQALLTLKGFEWSVIWSPLGSMQEEGHRLYMKECQVVERLQQSLGDPGDTSDRELVLSVKTHLSEIVEYWQNIRQLLAARIPSGSTNADDLIAAVKKLQEKLGQTAGALCKDFLDERWKALPADNGNEAPPAQPKDLHGTMTVKASITEADDSPRTKIVNAAIEQPDHPRPSGLSDKSLRLAEELVACVYATFITIVLLRIRYLVFSSVLIYTALVFSATSYPFQPGPTLGTLALLLFLLGALVIGYVYEEMHRDATLRNMTSTDPNKIDSAFWIKIVSAGLLPLLGLLTSLFPQVGHFLYTIAAPILQATR